MMEADGEHESAILRPRASAVRGRSPLLEPPEGLQRVPSARPFQAVTAQEAGSAIADDEFVLGVEVDGNARAYPLNMLGNPGREVVNDTLGGRPVAVTFCGLCKTPLVFSRRVDEKTLTFYVSGVLVESNMLIQDVETRSGWIQLLGKAVDGPLEGKELERIPSVWTDWKTWRTRYPATTAILLGRGGKSYSQTRPRDRVVEAAGVRWPPMGTRPCRQGAILAFLSARATSTGRQRFLRRQPLLLVFDPDRLSPTGFDRRLGGKELIFPVSGGRPDRRGDRLRLGPAHGQGGPRAARRPAIGPRRRYDRDDVNVDGLPPGQRSVGPGRAAHEAAARVVA